MVEPAFTRDQLHAKIDELSRLEADPALIAEKVLADLTAVEKRAVAALTLTGYIRARMGESHRHRPGALGEVKPRTGTKTYTGEGGKRYASPRIRDLAEWQAILGASIGGPDGRKFFGEFTLQEVGWLSNYRNKQAQQLAAQAERYAKIAEAMREFNVDRVKELPVETGLAIMREAPTE